GCSMNPCVGKATLLDRARQFAQVLDAASGNSEPGGIIENLHTAGRFSQLNGHGTPVHDRGLLTLDGRLWQAIIRGRMDDPRLAPSRPGSTRLPAPTVGRHVNPGAVVIRSPTPRVT